MDPRQRSVLAAICREYILRGEPVGSRSLVRRQGIEQSAATIRNVMADLEDQGLLAKPHTSAGRVPTDGGLRFFVDQLMNTRALSEVEQAEIRSRYQLTNRELQDLLREISRLLSDVSRQCGLVLVPRSESSHLKRIEFVPLRAGQLVAVLVMSSGLVQNRLVETEQPVEGEDLERIHKYLNDLCVGRELADVRRTVVTELEKEKNQYDELASVALKLGSEALAQPVEAELLVAGQTNLIERLEHGGLDRMKALLQTIEEKQVVLRLLDETIQADGVKVFIGAETQAQGMEGCAVVASAYGGASAIGTIGVLGPSNMDYPRVLPLVGYAASILTDLLEG